MKLLTVAAVASCALLASPAFAQEQTATATFIDAEGQEVGTANLTGTPKGVLIEVEATGLPADQWVAFHVHETGTCDHETDHESAGEHFNPADVEHGYLTETGPHAGDMPNQYVNAEGTLNAHVFNSLVTLDEGEAGIMGRALMIHGGGDDYQSQPSGDAGDRIACAVIE
ncbi:superoxide dismutase family protein [Pelagibacterium sp. 26DY04]|uniref:superoxide dismutase family protein n=1 Tax=unclassified Pelagibacterium TaxID=2623280 RepID=UPI00281516FE|nr:MULTISPECIES: superoxide dismutase family protein [unclassified Pelagibacterium]WMT85830.1 superoxide dismutase family protein [Pelagibacterium sp. 26DY04]WMT89886.1 superoxide dismutase family protein [Pelagibacterium sp. H642]